MCPATAAGKACSPAGCQRLHNVNASAQPCPSLPCLLAAVRQLEDEGRRLQRSKLSLRLKPVALYAGLPAAHQLGVFEPAPRGVRKVGGGVRAQACSGPAAALLRCLCAPQTNPCPGPLLSTLR